MISTEKVAKRSVEDRAASPIPDEPSAKRAKEEDVVETIADASVVASTSDSKPEVVDDEMDVSNLPADIVGTINKAPAEFKEEPYIYLSAEDEQVKMCMFVLFSSFC